MSPTAKYAGTAVDTGTGGGGVWTNPGNATGVPDATYASGDISSGGAVTNELRLTNFGFSIPSTAVIDGILVEFDRYGFAAATSDIQLVKSGSTIGTLKTGTDFWPGSEAFTSYGSSSDLWGATLAPADVNDSTFGVQLAAYNTHGGGNAFVDAVRITVYWHTAAVEIPRQKYYLYKVFDSQTGNYLGNLPKVSNEFAVSQDINTGGAQIAVNCSVSADTAADEVGIYTDESGAYYTDEAGAEDYFSSGITPFTGIGTGSALIRDGNKVQVWEYGYYHPNGICMFRGVIERHSDNFGGDTGNDDVQLLIYSDGSDMDNHVVKAGTSSYTLDQSQTSQNASDFISLTTGKGDSWNFDGQTFTVGTGVTNLGAISLLLNGTATVIISVYDSPALSTLLGSVSQFVSVGSATEIRFTFPLHFPVTASTQYFFTVTVNAGDNITIYYDNANPYAGGQMYNNFFGGGSGGGTWGAVSGSDLYFKTWSTTGSTTASFTSVDPSTGMLETIMTDYEAEGGKINIGNIEATGLTLSYGFNTNTTYEGLQAALSVSPNGFYYYVDLGTDLLYFQEANTQADYVLTKGIHINKLSVVSTIEYVVNTALVVGADTGSGNIYTLDQDATSVSLYGPRLQIHSDNNIPDTTTAHAVGESIVDANKNEQYQTSVTILDKTMDITLLVPGKIIGFNGFGSYVDNLLAQIVHRDYTPESVTLTLGILPKRTTVAVEQVVRGLSALNTVNNPSSPS